MAQANHWALVYGGAGQLGSELVNHFKSAGWSTWCVDFRNNDHATHNFQLGGNLQVDMKNLLGEIQHTKFNIIVCVAGGFAMESVGGDNFLANVEKMINYNIHSSAAAAHIAAKSLKEGGLLVLTGAAAVAQYGPTAGFAAYGLSKAAVHQFITTLASDKNDLPKDSRVVGLAPVCLDTATNRKDMPNANFDDWTPLPVVSAKLLDWAKGTDLPASGKVIKVVTKSKVTTWETL